MTSLPNESDDDAYDLEAELDALDVDKDFSLWTSFRSRRSIASSNSAASENRDVDLSLMSSEATPDETSLVDPNQLEMDDLEYWRLRLMRDEVYSPKYKPDAAEAKEFMELVKFLGMERKKLFEKEDSKWKQLSENTNNIILKRGPVLCQGEERELILLSHGLVLAKVEEPKRTALQRMMISRTYEQCDVYEAIEYIRSVPETVDVVIEVEQEEEKEEEGIEVEMNAGELVMKEVVESEKVSVSDEEEEASSGEEESASCDDCELEKSGNEQEQDVTEGTDNGDSNDENTKVDAEEADGKVVEGTAKSDYDQDEKKEEDTSGGDDDTRSSQEEDEKQDMETAMGKEDGDDVKEIKDVGGTQSEGSDTSNDNTDREVESVDEDEDSIESAKETKETQEVVAEPPMSPGRQLFSLFGGGKKAPENPQAKSEGSNVSSDREADKAGEDEDSVKSVEEEKETEEALPEPPLSPTDRRQLFSLFGGGKKTPVNSPPASPVKALETKSPEKHVRIETPPKKKQVTIQEERHSFVIKTETREFFFECATKLHKEAWLEALERVLVKTRSRSRSNKDRVRGWQHALVQTSLHSAAVAGLDELCCNEWLDARNELDKYNKLAPLHYATMGNMMHIMMYLLENGADPEVLDEDERTPMYYAQRDELMGAQSLLLDYGAKRSHLNDVEERGVLFQGAAQVAEAKAAKSNGGPEKKKSSTVWDTDEELKSHQQAATNAHGAMNDAMNELRIRGEKINDLAEKANALEDNVNTYGDLAKQMKARAKKKKWYKL